ASSSGDALGKAVLAVQVGDVLNDQLQAKQLLIQAQEIERPQVLTRAAAVKTTARSRRNSVVVAAFLGLVVGVIAALVWEPVTRERNAGVGAAIVTGYRRAVAEGIDVACVMAADNQMDPADLEKIALPVARGEVEYAKANRLISGEAWRVIPRSRYLGNAVLSFLTKIA